MKRTVFFISDGTGITAETLGHALLTQFEAIECREITLPFIDTPERAAMALEWIDRTAREDGIRPIVFTTLIDTSLREIIEGSRALVLDLFRVFMRPLEAELGKISSHVKGRSHGLVDKDSYDIRIEAINFTLNHDDGASTQQYRDAEVILIGVSRAGKTPTCLYLAMQFGIRAANYPLTEEDLSKGTLPHVLRPFRSHLYGLTINPDRLHKIRTTRCPNSTYASLSQCKREATEAEEIFCTERIPFLNTTSASIEEIAAHILQETGLKRRLF
jgi:[pyruvate, water dikinase]-phosphate phosphotransferase / [pyruvate, water dikinase] kinase